MCTSYLWSDDQNEDIWYSIMRFLYIRNQQTFYVKNSIVNISDFVATESVTSAWLCHHSVNAAMKDH